MSRATPSDAFAPDLSVPSGLAARVDDADAPLGLVTETGLLAKVNAPLLEELGFAPGDDLRGLPLASMWHHDEREDVHRAVADALRGGRAELELDLCYMTGTAGPCAVALEAAAAGLLTLTVACAR